jgi:hypothetical protein
MMEERDHATTQNRFYPDMSNVNKNIIVEAKLISPPNYIKSFFHFRVFVLHIPTFLLCCKSTNSCTGLRQLEAQYKSRTWAP